MPVITLLSDFGLRDAAAGIVRGIVYSNLPNAVIADISHEVSPFNLAEAAWILGDVYTGFPPNSIHLVLVDALYQAQPQMLLASVGGQYIIAPANGLLSLLPATAGGQAWVVHTGALGESLQQWVHAAAQVALQLQSAPPAQQSWPQVTIPVVPLKSVEATQNTLQCYVQYIDNFGNLITNLTEHQFQKVGNGRSFRITVGVEVLTRIASSCADVPKGDALCRFNSRGFLQVCVNKGNAASLLGFSIGGIYNHIKIQFV
jgi:hypothetical protein